MADDSEALKLRWREEAQAAVAQAQAEGEARGREAAAAEIALLRNQIEELGQQTSATEVNESIGSAQHASSRRAKSYLNELYGRLKEAGPDSMRTCVAGELATLTALLDAVALEATAAATAAASVSTKPAMGASKGGELEPAGSTLQRNSPPTTAHAPIPTLPQAQPPAPACNPPHASLVSGVTEVAVASSAPLVPAPRRPTFALPTAAAMNHAPGLKPSVCLWAAVVDTTQHRDGMFGHYIAYAIKVWAVAPLLLAPLGTDQPPARSAESTGIGKVVSKSSSNGSSSSLPVNGRPHVVACRREHATGSQGLPHGLGLGSPPSDSSSIVPTAHKRYSEFVTLQEALTKAASGRSESNRGASLIAMVPLLPPKKATAAHRHFEASFVAERQRALSLWLQHVTGHPLLSLLPPLATFCCGSSASSIPSVWATALAQPPSNKVSPARGGDKSGVKQWSHSVAESELKKVALSVTHLSKSLEQCLDATKQLKRATQGDVSALEDFGRAALSFKSDAPPRNPFTTTATAATTSATAATAAETAKTARRKAGGSTTAPGQHQEARPRWTEAQCFAMVGEAAVAVEVATSPTIEALLVGCVEPLRFQARCGVESAKGMVEKAQKRKGSELEEVAPGVCSEWHRLSHLRGACFTVGLADTARLLANSAAQAKAAWSEAAASLDDLLLDNKDNAAGDRNHETSFESAWEAQQASDAAAVSALLLAKFSANGDEKDMNRIDVPKARSSSGKGLQNGAATCVSNRTSGSGVGGRCGVVPSQAAAAAEGGGGAHDDATSFSPPPPPMRATIKRGLRRLPSQFVKSLKDFGMASIAALAMVAADPPSRYQSISAGPSASAGAASLNDAYNARAQAFARSEADKIKAEQERQQEALAALAEAEEHRKSMPSSSSSRHANSSKPIRLKDAAASRKDSKAPAIVRPGLVTPTPVPSSASSSSAPRVVPTTIPPAAGAAAPVVTSSTAPPDAATATAPSTAASPAPLPSHVPIASSHMSAKAAAKAVAAQASLAASAAPLPPPMPQVAPKPSAPATTATANDEKKATNAPSAESTEGSFSGPPPGHEPPPTTTTTAVPIPQENSEAELDPSATAPLPEGWQEVKQDNGGPNYFYHTRTRMSRWQKPDPAVAAEIEARYQAEEKATAEAQAQRVHEREVATAAAAAMEQEAQVLKREAEASVAAWQRKRSLPVLLGDLQAVYPNAPQLLQSDSSTKATVSSSEVKKAYMKAARALHPDKVQAGSTGPDGQVITPQVAAKAAVLFTALAALYEDYKTKADA